MKNVSAIISIVVLILFDVASVGPTNAAILKYSYIGNQFTDIRFGDLFTTKDRVTGYYIIDCGLIPGGEGGGTCSNLSPTGPGYRGQVIEFSVSAGPVTISSADEGSFVDTFSIETSSDSNIISWGILAGSRSADYPAQDTKQFLIETSSGRDFVDALFIMDDPENPEFNQAVNMDMPGTWTTQVVPIPAAIYMLASGLAVLAVPYWRRRRSAA